MSTLQDNIDENNLLSSLATVWDIFFKRILTTLESMLCGVKVGVCIDVIVEHYHIVCLFAFNR